jgi:CRP-like cAMP-binding protein
MQLWGQAGQRIRVIRTVAATGERRDSFRAQRDAGMDLEDMLSPKQFRGGAEESEDDGLKGVTPSGTRRTFDRFKVRDMHFSSHDALNCVFDVLEQPDKGLWRMQSLLGESLRIVGLLVAIASLYYGAYAAAMDSIGAYHPSFQFWLIDGAALLVFVCRFNTSLVFNEVEVCSRRRVWKLLALSPMCYADAASFLHVLGGLWHLLTALRMWRFFDQQSVRLTVDFKLTFFQLTATLALLAHLVACLLLAVGDLEGDYSALFRDAIFLLVGMRSAPTIETELVLSSVLVFIGTLSTGWILSSLLLAIDFARTGDLEHRTNVAKLQTAMQGLKVPPKLKARVLCYKDYCYRRKSVGTIGSPFEELSLPLQVELRLFLYSSLVTSVPYLKNACGEFIKKVTLALKDRLYLPSDYIIVAGERAMEMYFLTSGSVSVFSAGDEIKIAEITSSSPKPFFGEMGLLSDAPRMAHVRANTYVVCTSLSKAAFCSLLDEFPAEAEAIKRIADQRWAEVIQIESETSSPRTPVIPGQKQHRRDGLFALRSRMATGAPVRQSSSRSSSAGSESDEKHTEPLATRTPNSESEASVDDKLSKSNKLENLEPEDEEKCVEQDAPFVGIGADGRPISLVRDDKAIHPEEPTRRGEAHFLALPPSVDQTDNTHRIEFLDISS